MGNRESKLRAWENAPQSRSVVYGSKPQKPVLSTVTNNVKQKCHLPNFGSKETECFYCDEPLIDSNKSKDHVKPKSKGHRLSSKNKVWACVPCNVNKADRTLEQWKNKLEQMKEPTSLKSKYIYERREKIIIKIDYLLSVI